jgi:hypothetical protein
MIRAMSAGSDDLSRKVSEFAKATEVPADSFMMRRLSLDDSDQLQSIIDGMTLSLISYSYHRHPRGEKRSRGNGVARESDSRFA